MSITSGEQDVSSWSTLDPGILVTLVMMQGAAAENRANAETKDGTASLIVELREGLDRAATDIGASRLLLSVGHSRLLE